MPIPSECPICERRLCDHTAEERGQTFGQMMGDEPVPPADPTDIDLARSVLARARMSASDRAYLERFMHAVTVLRDSWRKHREECGNPNAGLV